MAHQTHVTIPHRLAVKLGQEKELEGYVHQSLAAWEPWLSASGMPFFPSFTDHGPNHLQRVLDTADWLITDDALTVLSPRDAACLVLAVLLHDSAMHLTEDSFRSLIHQSRAHGNEFDALSWHDLWESYLLEAKHWDARKSASIFGAARKNKRLTALTVYQRKDLNDLTESDRRFIGEFLRRHHARLAHEFALQGVPGPREPLRIFSPVDCPPLADLAGLIARSHGMPLRSTLAYLQSRYDGVRQIYGVLPVYIMGLLRIADYLDLHAERATPTLLRLKILRSALSEQEWSAHAAITDIRYGGSNDPERLEIIAMPESPNTYAAVVRWVRGIQAELDQTWAVFGEIYGGNELFRRLALRIRRITTPLEDEKRFAADKSLPFEPRPAQFAVSSRELLPLLAKPLYGDRPEIGIRELMQNAVDAVNELDHLIKRGLVRPECKGDLNALPLEFESEVLISICQRAADWPPPEAGVPESWQFWVEVIDRGVGMTPEIIRNYFLRAGASLRRDIEWMQTFTEGERARVIRSGRFGIGVLAAFALGEEIQVTSRHVSDPSIGTRFIATLDDVAIELCRIKVPVGTTIRVRIDETTAESLGSGSKKDAWDWYCLESPSVCRLQRKGLSIERLPQSLTVSPNQPHLGNWRRVGSDVFDTILWRPGEEFYRHRLYCNGIFVFSSHSNFDFQLLAPIQQLKQPDVVVIDPDERLPLTISRNALSAAPPYAAAVRRDALLDHCAWLLAEAASPVPQRAPFDAPMWKDDETMTPGDGVVEGPAYFVTDKGLVPATHWHLRLAGATVLTLYFTSRNSFVGAEPFIALRPDEMFWKEWSSHVRGALRAEVFGGFGGEPHACVALREMHAFTAHLVGRKAQWAFVIPPSMGSSLGDESRRRLLGDEGTLVEDADTGWISFTSKPGIAEVSELLRFVVNSAASRSNAATQGFARFEIHQGEEETNEFTSIWNELGLPAVIPFAADERRVSCAGAYKMLQPYCDRYASAQS